MASLKAAVTVMAVLAIGAGGAAWSTARATGVFVPGAELPFPWLVALAASNWYVRLAPWLTIFGVGGAAVIGAMLSKGTTMRQERQLLLGWIVIAGACAAADYLFVSSWLGALLLGFGFVSMVASVVVAAHLQHRLRNRGSRISGWYVAGAAVVLSLLGPLLLLAPVGVWVLCGRTLRQTGETA